jgi:hypothetical protein
VAEAQGRWLDAASDFVGAADCSEREEARLTDELRRTPDVEDRVATRTRLRCEVAAATDRQGECHVRAAEAFLRTNRNTEAVQAATRAADHPP